MKNCWQRQVWKTEKERKEETQKEVSCDQLFRRCWQPPFSLAFSHILSPEKPVVLLVDFSWLAIFWPARKKSSSGSSSSSGKKKKVYEWCTFWQFMVLGFILLGFLGFGIVPMTIPNAFTPGLCRSACWGTRRGFDVLRSRPKNTKERSLALVNFWSLMAGARHPHSQESKRLRSSSGDSIKSSRQSYYWQVFLAP